jgi:hypothetical protein
MEKKSWEKIEWLLFIIAIILVLLLSALSIYLDSIISGGANIPILVLRLLNQIIPGLVGTLLVVIVIYIFLKSRGIDANEQFGDQIVGTLINRFRTDISPKNIDSLVQKIASYKGARFLRLEHSKELFQFSEKLKTAKSIWINGYSCAQLFKEFRSEIKHALVNGTNFKLIITDPYSSAAKKMEERDIHPERVAVDINYVVSEINAIRSEVSKTKNKKTGKIDVKFIDWLPSCSMIFYNPDEEDGEVKIKVYPPFYSTNHMNPIEMIVDKKTYQDQFDYFHEQYDRLWNSESKKHEK